MSDTRIWTAALSLAIVLPLLASTVGRPLLAAQTAHTEHTIRLDPGRSSPAAAIEAFAFLQGEWEGEGMDGRVHELWSPAAAGTMVGAFRLVRDGAVVFYEFLALEQEGETVVLRLKHFNSGPGLPGWEERDDDTSFRLVRVEPDVAWFHGLTFRRVAPDELVIHLALRGSDRSLREEEFRLRRISR